MEKRPTPFIFWPQVTESSPRKFISTVAFDNLISLLYERRIGVARCVDIVTTSSQFSNAIENLKHCDCLEYYGDVFKNVFTLDGEFASDCVVYGKWKRGFQFLFNPPADALVRKGPHIRYITVAHVCGRTVIFDLRNDHGLGALKNLLKDPNVKVITWAGRCDACAIRNSFEIDDFFAVWDLQQTWMFIKSKFGKNLRNSLGAVVEAILGAKNFNDQKKKIMEKEKKWSFKQFWNHWENDPRRSRATTEYMTGDAVALSDFFFFLALHYPSLCSEFLQPTSVSQAFKDLFMQSTGEEFMSSMVDDQSAPNKRAPAMAPVAIYYSAADKSLIR